MLFVTCSYNDVNQDLDNDLISRINLNSSKYDEPYIKIHPNRQRMDLNDENLPTGVCLFCITLFLLFY